MSADGDTACAEVIGASVDGDTLCGEATGGHGTWSHFSDGDNRGMIGMEGPLTGF